MQTFPTISIVTPCYNSERYLEETILSVLQQNYPNIQYIIIDGGSTDKSVEIIKKYQDKLAYWISEKDNGLYDALQKGFARSTGEIMAWINADDLYHRNSFFIISELFTNFPQVNWLLGATSNIDENSRHVYVEQSRRFTKYDFFVGDCQWIQQESCFWRRSLWEKAGSFINTSLRYAGDLELWVRFFNYEKLYVTHSLIGCFRLRSKNQLSLEGMDRYLVEAESILKKQTISKNDKSLIRKYKIIFWGVNLINKLKKINSTRILRWYRKKIFGSTKEIIFNRITQCFEIKGDY
jgi:glycosyltransferase involved in cell wall biosynthesis